MMVAPDQEKLASKGSLLTQIVNSVTVSNFGDLFSSSNLLQLVVFAVLVGRSVAVLGDKAAALTAFKFLYSRCFFSLLAPCPFYSLTIL